MKRPAPERAESVGPMTSPSRRAERVTIAFGFAVWLAFSVVAVARPHAFFADDTYFYLRIARSVAAGEGSTFNGLMPTNGYHPLWLLMESALAVIVPNDRWLLLRLAAALVGVLNLASLILFRRVAQAAGLAAWSLGASLLLIFLAGSHLGSELHVSVPLLLASIGCALAFVRDTDEHAFRVFHVVSALALLARLDNLFGVICLYVAVMDHARRERALTLRALTAASVPYLGILGPYFAWNLVRFGALVPISGALKSGPYIVISLTKFGTIGLGASLGAVVALAASAWVEQPLRRVFSALAVGAVLHAAYVALRMTGEVWTWYFAQEMLAASLLVTWAASDVAGRVASRAGASGVRLTAVALAATWLLPAIWFVRHTLPANTDGFWATGVARWLDDHLPPMTPILVLCSPGALGYFTDTRIVAADGLTGDYAFQRDIAAQGIGPYLEAHGIRHVMITIPAAVVVPPAPHTSATFGRGFEGTLLRCTRVENGACADEEAEVYSRLLGQSAGVVPLRHDARLVTFPPPAFNELTLWQLPAASGGTPASASP